MRVLAEGGESIAITKELVTAPYSVHMETQIVPEGHVFVLGDNRDNARDSRFFGALPRSRVIGKVVTQPDST